MQASSSRRVGAAAARALLLLVLSVLLLLVGPACAATPSKRKPGSSQKQRQSQKGSIADREYNRKRATCSSGSQHTPPLLECAEQQIDLENCIFKCISQTCYDKVFGADPLEEGEVAFERTMRYKRCAKEELKAAYRRGETL